MCPFAALKNLFNLPYNYLLLCKRDLFVFHNFHLRRSKKFQEACPRFVRRFPRFGKCAGISRQAFRKISDAKYVRFVPLEVLFCKLKGCRMQKNLLVFVLLMKKSLYLWHYFVRISLKS